MTIDEVVTFVSKQYPISYYDLAGAVGIALTGVALGIIYLSIKLRPQSPRSTDYESYEDKKTNPVRVEGPQGRT
jgi:hypothetical protein